MPPSIDLVIDPREKDLGGFTVRRVLPFHKRKMVGPFIFFDHMGPAEFTPGKGVEVRPHPHIGLATVTYLFDGALLHRDTLGTEIEIRPRAVNWMTAGRGISHSERTPEILREKSHRLHGIQTWVALPKSHEEVEPDFTHFPENDLPRLDLDGAEATIIAGTAYGHTSPVPFPHGIVYVAIEAPTPSSFQTPEGHEEIAVYVVEGTASVDDEHLTAGMMAVLKKNTVAQIETTADTKLMIAGGEPMDGRRVIDWNFVSSSKERIAQARDDWRASAENWWNGTPFAMPPKENEYIPYPGDPQIEPPS